MLPADQKCSALYLHPKANFMKSGEWYIDALVSVNKLQNVVKDLCSAAGINDHFTNHSFRAQLLHVCNGIKNNWLVKLLVIACCV